MTTTAWAQVRDNVIRKVGLPRTGNLADGSPVSNYHLLPAEVLEAEGWQLIQDEGPPEYDPLTHFLSVNLEVVDGMVKRVYAVEELPPSPPEPPPTPVFYSADEAIDILLANPGMDPRERRYFQLLVESAIDAEEDPDEKARLELRYTEVPE